MAIVVKRHNLPPDVSGRGNVDLTAEVKYSVHFRPFRGADGASGSGFQSLNHLSYRVFQLFAFGLPSDEPE
jgi:hypothetical protein